MTSRPSLKLVAEAERILLDTSVLIAAERDLLSLPSARDVAIASLTVSEHLRGVHRDADPARRQRRAALFERVLGLLHVEPFDLLAARVLACVAADLDLAGTPIGLADTIIAATALATRRTLVTLNRRHFERVAGLDVREP